MEQFVKILTSILCQVIGFSRIRGLLIWEAISPQDCNNKDSVVVADSFIYPAHIYCILLCARYQRYIRMTKTWALPELTGQGGVAVSKHTTG